MLQGFAAIFSAPWSTSRHDPQDASGVVNPRRLRRPWLWSEGGNSNDGPGMEPGSFISKPLHGTSTGKRRQPLSAFCRGDHSAAMFLESADRLADVAVLVQRLPGGEGCADRDPAHDPFFPHPPHPTSPTSPVFHPVARAINLFRTLRRSCLHPVRPCRTRRWRPQ